MSVDFDQPGDARRCRAVRQAGVVDPVTPSAMKQNADLTLDFEYGRTPLFVRQTVAVAFGVPLGQEFTWVSLTELVRESAKASTLRRISVLGLIEIGVTLPAEANMVSILLKALKEDHPKMEISVALNR